MATTIQAIDNEKVKLRWEEEYVSEGLNEKMLGVIPGGIIRGGLLEPHPSTAMTLRVKADPVYGDIVASYEDVNGRQMTVNLGTGDVDLDLTALASTTVYIAIYVEYSLLTETAAEWRAYTQAQLDGASEKDRLIIWGSVDVPASGVIPAADIYQDSRRDARWGQSSGLVPWVPMLRNGGFEGKLAHWEEGTTAGSVTWSFSESEQYRGARSYEVGATGTGSSQVSQNFMAPCVPGQLFCARFMSKVSNWSGTIELRLVFVDKDGSLIGTVPALTETLTADTHDWEEKSAILEAPAGSAFFYTAWLYVSASASGTNAWVDDVQVFMQSDQVVNTQRPDDSVSREDRLFKLVFPDKGEIPTVADPDEYVLDKDGAFGLSLSYSGSTTGIFKLASSLYLEPHNNILPSPTETQDLGSDTKRWAEIWGNSSHLFDSADSPELEFFAEGDVGSYTRNRWRWVAGAGQLQLQAMNDGGTAYTNIFYTSYDGGLSDDYGYFIKQVRFGSADGVMPGADSYVPLGSTSIRWLEFFSDEVDTHELIVSGGVNQGCHDLIPVVDDTYDLGSTTYQWKDLYLDGVAYIDKLSVSTAVGEGVISAIYPDSNLSRQIGFHQTATPDGSNDLCFSGLSVGGVVIRKSGPSLYLHDTGGSADEKCWHWQADSDYLGLYTRTDSMGAGNIVYRIFRTATAVDNIRFGTDVLPYTSVGYDLGSTTYKWDNVYGANLWARKPNSTDHGPYVVWYNEDGTSGERAWVIEADGDFLALYASSDDLSSGDTCMVFRRTGTTFDDIEVYGDIWPNTSGIDLGKSGYFFSTGWFWGARIGGYSGQAGYLTYTGQTRTGSAGATYTVKGTSGATARDSAGFFEIYVGTTVYYVPYFAAYNG